MPAVGFSPTEGLVMATRQGDVDPGTLAWLAIHGVGAREVAGSSRRRGVVCYRYGVALLGGYPGSCLGED